MDTSQYITRVLFITCSRLLLVSWHSLLSSFCLFLNYGLTWQWQVKKKTSIQECLLCNSEINKFQEMKSRMGKDNGGQNSWAINHKKTFSLLMPNFRYAHLLHSGLYSSLKHLSLCFRSSLSDELNFFFWWEGDRRNQEPCYNSHWMIRMIIRLCSDSMHKIIIIFPHSKIKIR